MRPSFFYKQSKNISKDAKNLQKTSNQKQIKKELTESEKKDLERFIMAIESSGLDEFMEYIRSPWKMLWPNFVAGVARGIGALIGAAVVIAIIGWFLARLINLPLIGKELEPYVNKVQAEITRYTESTNYNDNFENMEKLLEEIHKELQKANKTPY